MLKTIGIKGEICMYVTSQSGRATIENIGGQVCIRIPTTKNILKILLLGAWLGAWFIGETTVVAQLLSGKSHGGDSFLFFWLCGWTVGGCWAIFILLWSLAGRERITVAQGMLKIEKNILGFGQSREYSLSSTRDFRVVADGNSNSFFANRNAMSFWGYVNGPIVFDYGMKTIKFGLGIDEAEAKYILEVLNGYIEDKTLIS